MVIKGYLVSLWVFFPCEFIKREGKRIDSCRGNQRTNIFMGLSPLFTSRKKREGVREVNKDKFKMPEISVMIEDEACVVGSGSHQDLHKFILGQWGRVFHSYFIIINLLKNDCKDIKIIVPCFQFNKDWFIKWWYCFWDGRLKIRKWKKWWAEFKENVFNACFASE